jgi:ribosomal protein L28
MATFVETRCDICGKLLPTADGKTPDSLKTNFESVRMYVLWNDKAKPFDLCPRCLRRMKRYLKKHGSEFDKVGDPDD